MNHRQKISSPPVQIRWRFAATSGFQQYGCGRHVLSAEYAKVKFLSCTAAAAAVVQPFATTLPSVHRQRTTWGYPGETRAPLSLRQPPTCQAGSSARGLPWNVRGISHVRWYCGAGLPDQNACPAGSGRCKSWSPRKIGRNLQYCRGTGRCISHLGTGVRM